MEPHVPHLSTAGENKLKKLILIKEIIDEKYKIGRGLVILINEKYYDQREILNIMTKIQQIGYKQVAASEGKGEAAPDGIALFGLDNKRVRHEIKKATRYVNR